MSDNLEFLPKPENLLELLAVQSTSDSDRDSDQEETVTVELPVDVLAALNQYGHQSGQTQTQSILDALRSALGLVQTPDQTADQPSDQTLPGSTHPEKSATDADNSETAISETVASETTSQATLDALIAEIEHLKQRLQLLEPLIPKVEDLVGKSIAF